MKWFKSYSLDRQTHGQTDRQTDTTENITCPHSRVVTRWQLNVHVPVVPEEFIGLTNFYYKPGVSFWVNHYWYLKNSKKQVLTPVNHFLHKANEWRPWLLKRICVMLFTESIPRGAQPTPSTLRFVPTNMKRISECLQFILLDRLLRLSSSDLWLWTPGMVDLLIICGDWRGGCTYTCHCSSIYVTSQIFQGATGT